MPREQIIVFTYHKSGTVLFERVMRAVGEHFGLTVDLRYGLIRRTDPAADIVLAAHSLIGFYFASRPFRGVRIVRDPRDVWVSGYLYHRHCPEGWCTNTNFDSTSPITYPRVDFSFEHCPEAEKRAYLARLAGKSYQQNLLDRDQEAGLDCELGGYTGCTLAAMRGWWLQGRELLQLQLETIAADYDGSMRTIFRHLGFSDVECDAAVELVAPHDIARMSDEAIAASPHIHSRTLSKWRDYLSDAQLRRCEQRYGDVITGLGYKLAAGG